MGNLIKCPMCGKDISPNAAMCPHCGEPIEKLPDPILSVNGEILIDDQYQNGTLFIYPTKIIVKNTDQTETLATLEYDSIKDLDSICNRPKKPGGFFRDISIKTYFNRKTREELPDFKITDKNILNKWDLQMMELHRYEGIKCPTCGSFRVLKISGMSKAGKALAFGVFALGSISKTFECESCGYKW